MTITGVPEGFETDSFLKKSSRDLPMRIPVSIGELVDKVTILSIKAQKIVNTEKLISIQKELDLLLNAMKHIDVSPDSEGFKSLMNVNSKLWDLENAIRMKERITQFDEDFIQMARAIYRLNDERTMLKRQINLKYHSELMEEKEYEPS